MEGRTNSLALKAQSYVYTEVVPFVFSGSYTKESTQGMWSCPHLLGMKPYVGRSRFQSTLEPRVIDSALVGSEPRLLLKWKHFPETPRFVFA